MVRFAAASRSHLFLAALCVLLAGCGGCDSTSTSPPTPPPTATPPPPKKSSGGKPFPKVEILYNTDEAHKQIAEALAQMWQNELGVTVSLGNTEWKVYLDKMKDLHYDLARAGWVWDYNDPFNMFECWQTGNGNNRTGWSNKQYDDLIDKAMTEGDATKRWAVFRDAEKLLCEEELPFLPIYFYVNKNMLSPRVKGWHDNVLNQHPFDAIWIEEGGSVAPPEKQRLVFNNGAEPATLDPARMSGIPEHNTALCLFEGLTRPDPKDLHPLPGVAEKWEVSNDQTTWTFHLRKEAKWSNGDPVTAKDFAWAWQRVINPKAETMPEPAEYAQVFDWIKGAKDMIRGTTPFDATKLGIEVKGDHTLVVTLARPCPFFLNLVAFPTWMPVHRATVEKHKTQWTRPDNIVVNGPFTLGEWKLNSKLVFTPNKHYWDKERPKLREVEFLPIDNLDTGLNKFLAKEVDWIDRVPPARADEVKKHADFRASPYLAAYYYRFNCTREPFNDPRVRRAFAMAIDKRTICTKVQKFGELPAGGAIPPGCGNPPYEGVKGLPYDPEKARALLREAGYEVPE